MSALTGPGGNSPLTTDVSSLLNSGGAQAPRVQERNNGFSELTSEEFVEIMIQELTNQDPLAPSDSQALLEQISTIRSIESDTALLDRLDSLVGHNEFASASGLIGALVGGINEQGRRVADVVLSVSRTDEGPVLNLYDGSRVPLSQVDEVVRTFDDLSNGANGDDETGGQP